jgi:hypothetical protein
MLRIPEVRGGQISRLLHCWDYAGEQASTWDMRWDGNMWVTKKGGAWNLPLISMVGFAEVNQALAIKRGMRGNRSLMMGY